MKTKYVFMIMMLYSSLTYSQLLNKANKWNDMLTSMTTCSDERLKCGGVFVTTHSYTLGRDTLIGGKTYSIINDTTYSMLYSNVVSVPNYGGSIREENKKVYYHNWGYEKMIYDFNLAIKDTFEIYALKFSVYKKDSVVYSGTKRLTIYLKYQNYDSLKWIEGIGSDRGLLYYNNSIHEDRLLCCTQNNTLLYKNNIGKDCIYTLSVSNKNLKANSTSVKVFPNPANEMIKVESPVNINTIEIFTLSGKPVQKINPGCASYDIDIRSLPKGLYFIKVNNAATTKFVKHE